MSPAPEVPAQPWHLQCRSRLLCLLPSLPEREVVSTLPPAERRVLFKPLKISARATIYPRHFPEPSPPALLPRLPAALALSCLAAFQGTQKGWHGWMPAPLCSSFVRSCSAHRCHDSSSLSSHHRCHGGLPISGLGMGGGSHVPWPGGHIQAPQPTSSRDVPWWAQGPLPQLPPPVRGLGSLPCFSPLLFPAASRTGFTGTLRPGCFPINCYFLIPFAARRAATQLRLSAGCPPALIEGRQDGAPPAPGWPQPWSPSPAQSQARSWSWF